LTALDLTGKKEIFPLSRTGRGMNTLQKKKAILFSTNDLPILEKIRRLSSQNGYQEVKDSLHQPYKLNFVKSELEAIVDSFHFSF
jgi:hypothetical protein